MRQGNGTDLLGANDPRSSTIGMIYVSPNDDRESVLAAILTQEKLGRKQVVIVLPDQNKAFQRPIDFDGLKNMRRKMQAQIVIVAPGGPGPAEFARQRRFPVFSSLESFTKSLQDDRQAQDVKRGWGFGRRPKPQPGNGTATGHMPPSPQPADLARPVEPIPHTAHTADEQEVSPVSGAPLIGAAGAAGLAAGLAMNAPAAEHEEMPPLAHVEDDGDTLPPAEPPPQVVDSSPAGTVPVEESVEAPPPPAAPASVPGNAGPGIIEFPQTRSRITAKLPVAPVEPIPAAEPEPAPVNTATRQRNSGKMAVVGAAGMAAGAGMSSRAVGAAGLPPTRANVGGGGRAGGPPPQRRRWRSLLIALVALLLLSLILFGGIALATPGSFGALGSFVAPLIGSPTATVTITPKSADVKNTYVILGVTGTPVGTQRQVQARLLSSTAPAQSKTVNATGVVNTPGVRASGSLTFSNGTASDFTVGAGTRLTGSDGVVVITDGPVTIPAANPPTFGAASGSAHAVNVGSSGNIGAGDIHGTCCSASNSIFVNNAAFGGGEDPQHYTVVQQSDVDGAANPLKGPTLQIATASLNAQKHTNEQFVTRPQCSPNVTSNPNVGDKASSVTVTVTAKCTGEVYDQSGAQSIAGDLLKKQATADPGANYALVGNLVTSVTQATVVDKKGTVSLLVKAEGVWVYQLSDAQKQQLAKLIAGKSRKDATALLQQQTGVAKVDSIDFSGGDILPTDSTLIKIVVQTVPGVPETPTVGSGSPPSSGQPTPTPTQQNGLGGS